MSDMVGYTKDGLVFMRLSHTASNPVQAGEPIETTILWKPDVAKQMGNFLLDAADAALAQNDKEGSKNDSSTTNRGRT
jgi:hypothetical protein